MKTQIGNATLYRGDCLEVMPTLDPGKVDLVLADPPYGTTQNKWDSVIPLNEMWSCLYLVAKENAAFVLNAAQPFTSVLVLSNIKAFKYSWIWDKGQGTGFLNAKKQPLRSTEDILCFYRKQATYYPQMREGKSYSGKVSSKNLGSDNYGETNNPKVLTRDYSGRYPLNHISFKRDKSKTHPTQKPVALMEYLIKTYTNGGETVLDFTMGSGTTGVAALNTGRKFIGIEKDAKYFNIACDRIGEAFSESL